jgi:uncharacterized phage protein (TIGR02218 family)
MKVSVTQKRINLEIDTAQAQGFFVSGVITLADILKGKFNDAQFTHRFCNADSIADGAHTYHTGLIGRVEISDNQFAAEMRGLAIRLNQATGHVTSKRCWVRTVGDAECQFDLDTTQDGTGIAFTQTLTVSSIVTQADFDVTGASVGGDDEWFTFGTATWLTGANAGYSSDIARSYQDGGDFVINLVNAPGADIQVGDTFSATAGCNRSTDHCKDKFQNAAQTAGNLVNFRGTPNLIGIDLYAPGDRL